MIYPGPQPGGTPASTALSASGMTRKSGNTRGSTNTNIIVYDASVRSNGSDVTHNDAGAAVSGSQFTINTTGVYMIVAQTIGASAGGYYIMANSSVTNTLTEDYMLACASIEGSQSTRAGVSIEYLTAGTIVWVHSSPAPYSPINDNYHRFSIERLK